MALDVQDRWKAPHHLVGTVTMKVKGRMLIIVIIIKCYFCIMESSSLIDFKILICHLAGFAEEKTSWRDKLVRALAMESDSPSFN